MERLTIATGNKIYEIADENGYVRGTISFNPTDMNFPSRAEAFTQNVQKLIEKSESITSELDEEKIGAMISELDKEIKKEIDMLFDEDNASKVVFGNQNCLSTTNGITFIERFLEVFIPIIDKEIKNELEKSNNRVQQYVSQVK